MNKVTVDCDCTHIDVCPQGRVPAAGGRCSIVRDERIAPKIAVDVVAGLAARISELVERLDDHHRRLVDANAGIHCERAEREAQLAEILEHLKPEGIRFTKDADGRIKFDPIDRIIKGGWMNVYRNGGALHWYSARYETREKADDGNIHNSRVACIKIPDFAEGDGL